MNYKLFILIIMGIISMHALECSKNRLTLLPADMQNEIISSLHLKSTVALLLTNKYFNQSLANDLCLQEKPYNDLYDLEEENIFCGTYYFNLLHNTEWTEKYPETTKNLLIVYNLKNDNLPFILYLSIHDAITSRHEDAAYYNHSISFLEQSFSFPEKFNTNSLISECNEFNDLETIKLFYNDRCFLHTSTAIDLETFNHEKHGKIDLTNKKSRLLITPLFQNVSIKTVIDNFAIISSHTITAALFKSVINEKIEKLKRLLKLGANPNTIYYNNFTETIDISEPLLHMAIRGKNYEITKLLLENGIYVDILNHKNESPLILALNLLLHHICRERHSIVLESKNELQNIIIELLEHGADPNAQDLNNKTPLMYAIETENLELIQLLLKKGADTNMQDIDNHTVLSYARLHDCHFDGSRFTSSGILKILEFQETYNDLEADLYADEEHWSDWNTRSCAIL